MEWLLKGILIWLSLDLVIVATIWYLSIIIPRLWPDWWKAVVVDTMPWEGEISNFYVAEFEFELDDLAQPIDLSTL